MEGNEEFSTSARPEFSVVQDGHDGKTEEEKRSEFAAQSPPEKPAGGTGDENGSQGAGQGPGDETSSPYAEASGTKGGTSTKKPVSGKALDTAAVDAYIALGKRQGATEARRDVETLIETSGAVNPLTGKPFASVEDLRKYGESVKLRQQQQEAKETKRRNQTEEERLREIQERDALMEKGRRAEAQERLSAEADKAQKARNAWLRADAEAFRAQYKDVSISSLEKDEDFREYCGDRYADGRHKLAELYGSYQKLMKKAGQAAVVTAEDKSRRGTGSSQSSDGGAGLSAEDRAALDRWNKRFPRMKMNEREFAAR